MLFSLPTARQVYYEGKEYQKYSGGRSLDALRKFSEDILKVIAENRVFDEMKKLPENIEEVCER